ncbi:MAG: cell division protein ZapE [Gemmatimonadota bacterium]|jgi:cell division protein ZapE|nr:cell division protein ZapE [Gemmatimonadota bacterium]
MPFPASPTLSGLPGQSSDTGLKVVSFAELFSSAGTDGTARVGKDGATGADAIDAHQRFAPPPRFGDRSFSNYIPQHPSQVVAMERLSRLADDRGAAGQRGLRLSAVSPTQSVPRRFGARWLSGLALPHRGRKGQTPAGIYLDGGFGVGKTHLLVAFWNAVPGPRAYLSFDELMFHVGLVGVHAAAESFKGHQLIAIDEWELDDPGNLKLALAFLRGVIGNGVFVAVTSNTLPLELGAGRFSQKDFHSEIEELASGFEVVTVEGKDYRHRHFEADPGRSYFLDPATFELRLSQCEGRVARGGFPDLLAALGKVHPVRYRSITKSVDALFVEDVVAVPGLFDALRWVHFVDSAYDAGTRLVATGGIALGELFAAADLRGPYGKKLSRCLSRMEEMLGA